MPAKRIALRDIDRKMLEAHAKGVHPNSFLGEPQIRVSREQVRNEIAILKRLGYSKRNIAIALARHNPYAVIEALLK